MSIWNRLINSLSGADWKAAKIQYARDDNTRFWEELEIMVKSKKPSKEPKNDTTR